MKYKSKKNFQTTHSLSWRQENSKKIREKYPGKVPVIVFPIDLVSGNPEIDKTQFLVDKNVLLCTFLNVIKKRLIMKPSEALFLFINGRIPMMTKSIFEIYNEYTDNDGFLYIEYSIEQTFG